MQIRHHPDEGDSTVLADRVRIADGFVSRTVGLMGRKPLQPGEAMLFRFRRSGKRQIHTMFVRAPIDVIWIEAERVTGIETFEPWSLGATNPADTVVELPAGEAAAVAVGDVVRADRVATST